MFEWIGNLLQDTTFNILISILGPVLGFVLIAGVVRVVYERFTTRARRTGSNGARSMASQPLNDLAQWAQDYYRTQGYDVLARAEADQPGDTLVAVKGDQRIAIRCLNQGEPATAGLVSALAAARDQQHAQRAVLVSLTDFPDDIRQHAARLGVELREGPQVELMINVAMRRRLKEGAVIQGRTA